MKALILAAAFAVACTGFASANEVKKDTTKAPVVASKSMTDTDMDKVTAGGSAPLVIVDNPGRAYVTAPGRSNTYINSY